MQAREIQRKILEIIATLQEGSRNGSVNDAQIAEKLNLTVEDVQMHLDLMRAEDTVRLIKAKGGYIAFLEPKGQVMLKDPDYFQQQSLAQNLSYISRGTNYHLSNIRALLTSGFTPDELRRFCYDTPEFRAVYDELAGETGKAKIIDLLLEHAERKGHLDLLLAWAKTESPTQYAAHEPYLPDRRPPTHSAGSG